LTLGSRPFFAEISAAATVCRREPDDQSRLLFIRSVRKLLTRFSPVLWEDEPRFKKVSESLLGLEEALDEVSTLPAGELDKSLQAILKQAGKLEAEGLGELIPIGQIRRAAAWSHLAPTGKRKLLLIENADRMQDAARNALLKMLEEPPASVIMVLTSAREKALLPTVMSRLRPYRFIRRSPEVEGAVIRQVFRDTPPKEILGIEAYLASFLPVSEEALRPAAAFFAAYVARGVLIQLKRWGITRFPEELVILGAYASGLSEASPLGKPGNDPQSVIAQILAVTEKFEVRGLFVQFLRVLLAVVMESRFSRQPAPVRLGDLDVWRKCTAEAALAVGTYNQSPVLALERLSIELRQSLATICRGGI
jgi:DNA polymerase-3 subunit gamma/tau